LSQLIPHQTDLAPHLCAKLWAYIHASAASGVLWQNGFPPLQLVQLAVQQERLRKPVAPARGLQSVAWPCLTTLTLADLLSESSPLARPGAPKKILTYRELWQDHLATAIQFGLSLKVNCRAFFGAEDLRALQAYFGAEGFGDLAVCWLHSRERAPLCAALEAFLLRDLGHYSLHQLITRPPTDIGFLRFFGEPNRRNAPDTPRREVTASLALGVANITLTCAFSAPKWCNIYYIQAICRDALRRPVGVVTGYLVEPTGGGGFNEADFYAACLECDEALAQVAHSLLNVYPQGAALFGGGNLLYLENWELAAPYRGHGLGQALLERALRTVTEWFPATCRLALDLTPAQYLPGDYSTYPATFKTQWQANKLKLEDYWCELRPERWLGEQARSLPFLALPQLTAVEQLALLTHYTDTALGR